MVAGERCSTVRDVTTLTGWCVPVGAGLFAALSCVDWCFRFAAMGLRQCMRLPMPGLVASVGFDAYQPARRR